MNTLAQAEVRKNRLKNNTTRLSPAPDQAICNCWHKRKLPVFASVLLCCLAGAGVIYWRTHSVATSVQVAQSTPVAVTIDFSRAGTTRGTDTATVLAVVLPRRVVNAHVILPNFSPGGNYVVSVTTDRSGASGKAAGRAVANVQGFHADLTVTLDLRSLPPGTYFLATTHEGDPSSYFYPLSVN